ncbi:MAG: glutathione S-transferase [Pseudohongiellaceae bacterium]|jgi:glutathione S-transferase
MSIKLYGFPISNYYNMVKAVLIEKGMDFEEVLVKPNQDADYLSISPMGKVPALETEHGFLTETGVMIDYLDSLGEGPSFYPQEPYQKAKVQEIIRYLELYVELPARRLYGDVFFGKPASEALKAEVRPQLEKGFTALAKIAKYDPYIAGKEVSYADFYFRFSFNLATLVCKKGLDWNAQGEFDGAKNLMKLMDERASIQKVLADQKA